jgi:pimeloyl-ACP methyl ester carboxylesterase
MAMTKRSTQLAFAVAVFVLNAALYGQQNAGTMDSTPHTVRMIAADKDVTLEVLDWGGTGRPLVLLTGLGDNGHVFDKFAAKLTRKYHVYGITRRGFEASSKPVPNETNYTAARLGEDVLAVIDALHLSSPVLAGHSVAGEELSYIAVRHPEKVAGVIYLDAGYSYALYDELNGSVFFDANDLRRELQLLLPGKTPSDATKFLSELQLSLTRVERWVSEQEGDFKVIPQPPSGARPDPPAILVAVMDGQQKFTTLSVPALVIFALPHDRGQRFKDNPAARAAAEAIDRRNTERQATAFERQVPSAHVVRIPNANHYVFRSNEVEVLREMNAFIAALPAAN